jgi:hypothetical protein
MADRFGPRYDLNRDGRPDLPNSYEYVNPGRYEVHLVATAEPACVGIISCEWAIEGPGGSAIGVEGRPG